VYRQVSILSRGNKTRLRVRDQRRVAAGRRVCDVFCSRKLIRLRKAAASMYSIPTGIRCSRPNCNSVSIMFSPWILNELTGRDGISEP